MFMHKNVLTLPVRFILYILGSFYGPIKEIRQVLFKDLNRIQGLFKTTSKIQDLSNLYELWVRRRIYNVLN